MIEILRKAMPFQVVSDGVLRRKYDLGRFRALFLAGALIMAFNVTMTILGHVRGEEPIFGETPVSQAAE